MAPRRQKANNGKSASPEAAAAEVPALTLTVTAGPAKGVVFDKQADTRRQIGRVARGNQVHVKDAAVSQQHALVEWTGTTWTLIDLGSSNGTFLNGEEVKVGDSRPLSHGDVIRLGTDSELEVEIASAKPRTVEDFLRWKADAVKRQLMESLAEGLRQIAEECEEQCRLVRDEADVDAAFQVAPTAA